MFINNLLSKEFKFFWWRFERRRETSLDESNKTFLAGKGLLASNECGSRFPGIFMHVSQSFDLGLRLRVVEGFIYLNIESSTVSGHTLHWRISEGEFMCEFHTLSLFC